MNKLCKLMIASVGMCFVLNAECMAPADTYPGPRPTPTAQNGMAYHSIGHLIEQSDSDEATSDLWHACSDVDPRAIMTTVEEKSFFTVAVKKGFPKTILTMFHYNVHNRVTNITEAEFLELFKNFKGWSTQNAKDALKHLAQIVNMPGVGPHTEGLLTQMRNIANTFSTEYSKRAQALKFLETVFN